MINKIVDLKTAISHVKKGDTVLIGGFGGIGVPGNLCLEIVRQNIGELTVVAEDFGNGWRDYDMGSGHILKNGLVKKAILSFCGGQIRITELVFDKKLDLELTPQGTLAERIRAGGAGLGGFYTPVGVGTQIAEGKETKIIDGKEYLFEKPIHGDVALIKAYKADTMGNAIFKYSGISFNPVMATAADTVIMEVEHIVEPGEIEPDRVQLPGVFVDYIVEQKEVAV